MPPGTIVMTDTPPAGANNAFPAVWQINPGAVPVPVQTDGGTISNNTGASAPAGTLFGGITKKEWVTGPELGPLVGAVDGGPQVVPTEPSAINQFLRGWEGQNIASENPEYFGLVTSGCTYHV